MEERWPSEPLLARHPNLVALRSLTKDHALPGLRLGYALAARELASAFEAVRPPWSVNAGALRAGLATLHPDANGRFKVTLKAPRNKDIGVYRATTMVEFPDPSAPNFRTYTLPGLVSFAR